MSNKCFSALLAAIILLAAGLFLASCTKTRSKADLGSYTLQMTVADAASKAKADQVYKKMQSTISNSVGTSSQYERMDMIVVGVLNPVYSNNKTVGNFEITLYWSSASTDEPSFVHRYTFSTSGD